MVTLTLAVPAELKQRMERFPEMNWSEVARQAFIQRINDMEFLKEFTAKSRITDKDALRWGKELNKKLASKYVGAK